MLFALLGAALGVFDLSLLGALGQRVFGILTNQVLIAIPLFVFMGIVLEKSRIAEDLLTTMGRLFGRRAGGLGVSVVLVGALLAASTWTLLRISPCSRSPPPSTSTPAPATTMLRSCCAPSTTGCEWFRT